MFPYDYPLLWTSDAVEPAYLDQLETHLKFLHQSPPLIARVLNIMIAMGFTGFFVKLFRASEANMLFDGASLLMYLIGVGIYIANIVKGLRMVSAGYWDSEEFRNLLAREVEGASSSQEGGAGGGGGGEMILGREDSLKVLAASNTILALVLVGVLVLQSGQWYAERKDKEEAEKFERSEKEKNTGSPSAKKRQ
ncbi:hypothetical protein DL766_002790 [Monosporascus sp. MC13-8B]|uniref:ER membrane protein SH3 n=1 Tax=Monosporascus cannonballus TaxID=155416 RepID=A0ABY0HAM9_9PEZI|nr:hypothetical protein DL763_006741 [Monosporascus cannonballus]RYO89083.1 hypothetical protein DL762_003363 [Monosporascus cannonballus]RYP34800.1 hypothetical protein DL766_002790 [Monosporascus sp. MC13-8B]